MADSQELAVQDKKELATKEEKAVPARYFVPSTDIYETEDALTDLVNSLFHLRREHVTASQYRSPDASLRDLARD